MNRRYSLLLDLGGIFHILPDRSQTQERTHRLFRLRATFKGSKDTKEMFAGKVIPQLDGSLFYCFPMPLGIQYTMHWKLKPFKFERLQKMQFMINGDVAARKSTVKMGVANRNIMKDESAYPYERGIYRLIDAIKDLDPSAGDIYSMDASGVIPSNVISSGLEYKFYHMNTFLNGWRGIPVVIDHGRKIFWNFSWMFPELEAEDGIGVIINDLSDIQIGEWAKWGLGLNLPEMISCLGGPQLCPHCGIVSDFSKPREQPWLRYKQEDRRQVYQELAEERGLEVKVYGQKKGGGRIQKMLGYLPPDLK